MGWVREKEHFSGIIAERILEFVPHVVCLHCSNDVEELSVDRIVIQVTLKPQHSMRIIAL